MPPPPSYLERITALTNTTPGLEKETNALCERWLAKLLLRLDDILADRKQLPHTKQINDPIWKLITLEPAEILLLDSPLLQRMRGVRQLGLAHLVFPGATHDRFSHACGVLEAASRMFDALSRNAEERRQTGGEQKADARQLDERKERWVVRIAALLHDIGHGPFSHVVEPVVQQAYASEIAAFNVEARQTYNLNENLNVAEVIAVLIVLSPAMRKVFEHSSFPKPQGEQAASLLWRVAVLIMGGRHKDLNVALSAIISSQVDADKLDYMSRDAHHSGMPIAFDTERLLGKLELIRCTPETLPIAHTDEDKQKLAFAEQCDGKKYYDVGVVNSGVGALEQMLVGRAFLYDRLYFHHKVRAADAMAQRLLYYAQPSGRQFTLSELYLDLADDTLVRLLGGVVSVTGSIPVTDAAKELAADILERDLYHRAIAFRARFHHTDTQSLSQKDQTDLCANVWSPLSTDLSKFGTRIELETEIFAECQKIAPLLGEEKWRKLAESLRPWHIVVDLPENRVKAVSIYVSAQDGTLELPNLFFDPARWSQVYNLEKRTGYVFCPPKFTALVAAATKIILLRRWNYVGTLSADRLTKTTNLVPAEWFESLKASSHLDQISLDLLTHRAVLRRRIKSKDISDGLPKEWSAVSRRLSGELSGRILASYPLGLEFADSEALTRVVSGLAHYLQHNAATPPWPKSEKINEVTDLQQDMLKFLRPFFSGGNIDLPIVEGAKQGAGFTDVVVGNRIVIENKVASPGEDPFKATPDAVFQGERYERAFLVGCLTTLVAYRPTDASSLIAPSESVRAIPHDIGGRKVVEIRFAVPYGEGIPSRAKAPKSPPPNK